MAAILFNGLDLTATSGPLVKTVPICSRNGWSVDATLTGVAFSGTWKLEVSNGGVIWTDVTAQIAPGITQPTVLTGVGSIFAGAAMTFPPADLLRLTLTRSAGTASGVFAWLSEALR